MSGSSYNNYTHTVLLDSAGRAYAAGYNSHGECGVGTTNNVLIHKLMALSDGVQGTLVQVVTMGYSNVTGSQLLDARGRVWACGYNGGWMLGLGETNPGYLAIPARVRILNRARSRVGLDSRSGLHPMNDHPDRRNR